MVFVFKKYIYLELNEIICLREYLFPIHNYIFGTPARRATREIPTLKQFISLEIRLKRVMNDYNHGRILQQLRARGLNLHNLEDYDI